MKTPPQLGLLALAAALLLTGCGGGAASERTATSHPGATASPALMITVTLTPVPASPSAARGSSSSTATTAVTPQPLSGQGISPSAVAAVFTATATAGIGWFPASTTPCQPEGEAMGHSRFANPEQYARNLRCAVTLFGWPPRYSPDLDTIIASLFDRATQEGGSLFEIGVEFGQVTIFNRCAWYLAWLEARQNGDTATEAAALDVMLNIIPNYESVIPGFPANVFSPGVVTLIRDAVKRASLGDPSLVQQFVDVQCRAIPWQTS